MAMKIKKITSKIRNISLYRFIVKSLVIYSCALSAYGDVTVQSSRISVDYRSALNLQDAELDLSRLTLSSTHEIKLSRQWSGQIDIQAHTADDNVGLGGTDNYASANRPLVDNSKGRLELSRAFIMWRKRATSLIIGKQVTPWGVLDGIQVTDRFDPVRRRDFVFTDVRPERIARWGVRWRSKIDSWSVDTSFAFDGSASQQAEIGDTFFFTSTRFTGGLALDDVRMGGQGIEVVTPRPSHSLKQSTAGIKVAHSLGEGDMSLIAFRGPDTDPILSFQSGPIAGVPIKLSFDYKRRTVLGATYDTTAGAMILRMELAYIPDQPLNILAEIPLSQDRRKRMLAGFGIDWPAPDDWFVNAQVVLDYIDKDQLNLVRPSTDTLLTLRAQRSFYNARLLVKAELLGSVNQGDGVIRPVLAFDLNDRVKLQSGIDWLFGDSNGQFGQFKDVSRLWSSATYTF
ncbi:MAG: hypothetical protein ACI9J5_002281 [Paraglaciecola sp.]|jgi:hypothetical protein